MSYKSIREADPSLQALYILGETVGSPSVNEDTGNWGSLGVHTGVTLGQSSVVPTAASTTSAGFNGTSGYLDWGGNDPIGTFGNLVSSPFSIEIVRKSSSTTTSETILGVFDSGNSNLFQWLLNTDESGSPAPGEILFHSFNTGSNQEVLLKTTGLGSIVHINDNQPHNLWITSAGSVDDTTDPILYVDGHSLASVTTVLTNTKSDFTSLAVPPFVGITDVDGTPDAGGAHLSGNIGWLAFYASAVSAANVLSYYQAGQTGNTGRSHRRRSCV